MTTPPFDNNQNPYHSQQDYQAPQVPQPPPPPSAHYGQQPYVQSYAQPHAQPYGVASQQNESNAVLALIFGILGVTSCGVLGIVAIVMGNKSRRNIAQSNGYLGGDGMAKAGVVLGWISIGLLILGTIFYAIYFLIILSGPIG